MTLRRFGSALLIFIELAALARCASSPPPPQTSPYVPPPVYQPLPPALPPELIDLGPGLAKWVNVPSEIDERLGADARIRSRWYYTPQLPAGTLDINVDTTAPNVGVELYDDSVAFADRARNRIAISEPGRFRATISAPVDAGIYYIRLYSIDDSSTTAIHVRLGFSRAAPPAPPAIGTPPSSTIEVQPAPRRSESPREQDRQYAAPLQRKLHGAIGRGHPYTAMWYQLALSQPSIVTIVMRADFGSPHFTVFEGNRVLAHGGAGQRKVTLTLAAGTYHVKSGVRRDQAASYTIEASVAEKLAEPSPKEATDLNLGRDRIAVGPGSGVAWRWQRVKIVSPSFVRIKVTVAGSPATVTLFDETGTTEMSRIVVSHLCEIDKVLAPGTYLVRSRSDGPSNIALDLEVTEKAKADFIKRNSKSSTECR
jgi:hypothetical protein